MPRYVFTAADVRRAEEPPLAALPTTPLGISTLMDRAATGLAHAVAVRLRARRSGGVRGARVVVLAGAGNNGGDALMAGAALAARGAQVVALTIGPIFEPGRAALTAAGGQVVLVAVDGADGAAGEAAPADAVGALASPWRCAAPVCLSLTDALEWMLAADAVLDGILGIGARGAMRGGWHAIASAWSALVEGAAGERPIVVAVDLPSGMGVDDGTVPGSVIAADVTVTFGALKAGLLLPPAALSVGEVDLVDIGLGPHLARARPTVATVTDADVRTWLVPPAAAAHKYTRGVLGVLAGSVPYPGAAVLTVRGATAASVGMVRYLGPASVADAVVQAVPETVPAAGHVQAFALGPGVAVADADQYQRVLSTVAAAASAGRRSAAGWQFSGQVPMVIDAGALSAVPAVLDAGMSLTSSAILTPHAGELAVLLSELGLPCARAEVENEPLRCLRDAAQRTGATVLLKGPVTLVAGPDPAEPVLAVHAGTPWLATAGAGDVLTGVLGALLAANTAIGRGEDRDFAVIAAVAATIHGWAGRLAAADPDGRGAGQPITAGLVANAVPAVIGDVLARRIRGGIERWPAGLWRAE